MNAELELVIPLASEAGNVWHVLRRRVEVELPPFDDPEEELVACVPVELEVDGRALRLEARFVREDLAGGVLTFPPVVIDPVPGGPGEVDADGRVDGRVVVEEAA